MQCWIYKIMYLVECSISIILLSCIIILKIFMSEDNKLLNQNIGKVSISIQHESNPLSVDDINIYRSIERELFQIANSEYYEIYTQPIRTMSDNLNLITPNEDQSFSALQISQNVQVDFDFSVQKGKLFCEEDFTLDNDRIPVILGAHYNDIFDIGDKFEGEYLYDRYDFIVIGILTNHSGIDMITGKYILDDKLIIPSFNISDNSQITEGIKIHYANKVSGKLFTDKNNIYSVIKSVHDILENTPAGEFSVYTSLANINIFLATGLKIEYFFFLIGSLSLLTVILMITTIQHMTTSSKYIIVTNLFVSSILFILFKNITAFLGGYYHWKWMCLIVLSHLILYYLSDLKYSTRIIVKSKDK